MTPTSHETPPSLGTPESHESHDAPTPHASPKPRPPVVLFLCVHNAGRSQMAAAWTKHLAGDRVHVVSGGSMPSHEVHPGVVAAMSEVGIDLGQAFPKAWTDETVQAADVVITMGCGDECPFFPGKRYEDWEVADPAGADVEAVRPIRDEIRTRVEELLRSLGVRPTPGA